MWSFPPAMYAIRVSVRVPIHLAKRGLCRGRDHRTVPVGSIAESSSLRVAAMKRPCGDQAASRKSPRRRREPSARTIQVPPRPLTSSRPRAGSEKRLVSACSTPTALRSELTTERPGGLTTAATATAATAPTASGRQWRRGQATGSRGSYAAGTGPVDRAVDDDPVQPGTEGPPAVEPVERAHRGKKRFLGDVLGCRRVADDEISGAVRRPPVRAKERLEVRDRPGLGPPHPGP